MLLSRSGKPMLSRAGKPLLQAPPNVAAPAQPPAGTTDVDFAKAFVAPLITGINIERWRVVTMQFQGANIATNSGYWSYLKLLGLTHVRITLPWRVSTEMFGGWVNGVQPTDAQLDQFLQAAQTISLTGFRVLIDCTDIVSASDFTANRAAIESVIGRMGAKIAALGANLPTSRVAVGPFHELDFPTNTACNEYRLAAHNILRSKLPNHVLMTGAALSMAPSALLASDWQMVADRRVILTVHDFPGTIQPTYLQNLEAKYKALSALNGGVPIMATMVNEGTHTYDDGWATLLDQYTTYQPLRRVTYWSVTDGGWFALNASPSDPTILPQMIYPFQRASGVTQNAPEWLAENPGYVPPPIPQPPTTGGGTGGTTTKALSLTPQNPAGPGAFTTTIQSANISQLLYVVINNATNYPWVDAGAVINATGSNVVTVTLGNNQALRVQDNSDSTVYTLSGFTPAAVNKSLSFSPANPSGAGSYTVTVTSTGISQLQYGVVSNAQNFPWVGTPTVVAATGSNSITVTLASNQALRVQDNSDASVYQMSGFVAATGGGKSLSFAPSNPTGPGSYTVTISSSGISQILYVVVNNATNYPWADAGTVITATGSNVVTVTLGNNQGLRVQDNSDSSINQVSGFTPAGSGTGTGTGTGGGTTAGTIYEGFDNNGPGILTHVWAQPEGQNPYSMVSWSGGILRIQGLSGAGGNVGAGVMEPPRLGDRSTGHGYGLYEFRIKYSGGLGNGSGPAVGLWPGSDAWPGPEIDCGEIDGNGTFYCAHHWRGSNGADQYRIFPAPGLDWWNWHTSAVLITPGRLEYFVDGNSIGVNFDNVTPMYNDGGENRLFFTMNRSAQTTCEVDWVKYTPR